MAVLAGVLTAIAQFDVKNSSQNHIQMVSNASTPNGVWWICMLVAYAFFAKSWNALAQSFRQLRSTDFRATARLGQGDQAQLG